MKTLYLNRTAPNPRKAIILLQAKGLDVDDIHDIQVVDVDLGKGEQFTASFTQINPLQRVPVLKLEDGTQLNDSQAVCEYLDRVYGERSVMGNDVVQRAKVCSMRRIAELDVLYNFMLAFQYGHPAKAEQIDPEPEFAKKAIQRAIAVLPMFDKVLTEHNYLVNDQLSFADIVLYLALDFGRVLKVDPTAQGAGIAEFYQRMNDEFGLKK